MHSTADPRISVGFWPSLTRERVQISATSTLKARGDGGLHLGLNIPLRLSGEDKLFAMLSFAIDPEKRLFPMIDRWPGPARTGGNVADSQGR